MVDNGPNTPKDPLYSNRVEDKFILPMSSYDRVVSTIEKYLKPYYPAKSTEFTQQKSIYLETPEFQLLQDHLNDLDNRYKVRMRLYGPNGKWSQEEFLEIKYREDGNQKKVRIRIDNYTMVCLRGQKSVPDKTQKLNQDIADKDYQRSIKVINTVFKKYLLDNITEVEYKRLSYRNSQSNVRLTVDTGLKATPRRDSNLLSGDPIQEAGLWDKLSSYNDRFVPSAEYVVEIKYEEGEDTPTWFQNLMDREDDKFKGFSKFAWSMGQCLD